jgi:N-hydroxyarylamine O-acetyltransferase
MPPFALDRYLNRIGVDEVGAPDAALLARLHRAHVTHIPFENLDIQLGRPIRLDLDSLQAKLVGARRGGYCFEQNTLFKAALETIGFDVSPREARVRVDGDHLLPRTHMVLAVSVDGRPWLCDVGFGGDGLVDPVRIDGSAQDSGGRRYRVATEGPRLVLESERLDADAGGAWRQLYAIEPSAPDHVDFEVANWYTSTHPESRFVLTLTAQRAMPDARHILRNLDYTVDRGGTTEQRTIAREALGPLLRDVFGLDLPDDSTFRGLDAVTTPSARR